jgi:hypothetical protein
MNLNDATLRVAILKVLADEVAGRLTAEKSGAHAGFTGTGATQAVPQLPDGTRVATVSLAGAGKKTASVTGPNALLAWVLENHPGETETVVRDSYLKKLLDTAKSKGRAIDPATGQVVPGITVSDGSEYLSVRFKPGGREAIVAAWLRGDLADIELVAVPAIENGEAA